MTNETKDPQTCTKVAFTVDRTPLYAVTVRDGRKGLEVQAFDGLLTVAVQYTYDRRPLELTAEVQVGDRVEVLLMPHRIELSVGGVLRDEEWPAGECLYFAGDPFLPALAVEVTEVLPRREEPLPSVLSTFETAEGWYPAGGVFVGDCMPYERDGEYHVLYLKDRRHHRSKWGLGAHQWEHISSKDLKVWSVHPTAVPITDPSEGSICTGSWIRDGGREYLFYTVRRGKGQPAPIRRSVSEDGYHFTKDEGFGFTLPARYKASSARDPKVIRTADGVFHMFLTTTLVAENRGCLAHFVSDDLDVWRDAGEPIYVSADGAEPECPDYFAYAGRYYLVYSLRSKAHYAVSDAPLGPFREPEDPIIPCESVPKGAVWGDRLLFVGFRRMGGYAGSMTFRSATAGEDGRLIFAE